MNIMIICMKIIVKLLMKKNQNRILESSKIQIFPDKPTLVALSYFKKIFLFKIRNSLSTNIWSVFGSTSCEWE